MKSEKTNYHEEVDRGVFNSSYLMILLSQHLARWAKNHYLNTSLTKLMFVLQIESENLADVYLSLVYEDQDGERIIPAGYVGQRLSSVEKAYCEKLPKFTLSDLEKKPPISVMMKRFENLKDDTGIVLCVAECFSTLMVETCVTARSITAGLAAKNGTAILFLRDNSEYVTKMEFHVEDIIKFINSINAENSDKIKQSVRNILTHNKHTIK